MDSTIEQPRITATSVRIDDDETIYVVTYEASFWIRNTIYPFVEKLEIAYNDIERIENF